MTVLLVAVGAAVGAPLRFLVDQAVRSRYGGVFPWGTFAVNVAGSALLGFVAALPAGPGASALWGTGFCGALTTYSTLGWETLRLVEGGARGRAVLNVVASVGVALAAAWLAAVVARGV